MIKSSIKTSAWIALLLVWGCRTENENVESILGPTCSIHDVEMSVEEVPSVCLAQISNSEELLSLGNAPSHDELEQYREAATRLFPHAWDKVEREKINACPTSARDTPLANVFRCDKCNTERTAWLRKQHSIVEGKREFAKRGVPVCFPVRKSKERVIPRFEPKNKTELKAHLLRSAHSSPYVQYGKIVGMRFFSVQQSSKWSQWGINKGDILREVNGVNISNPAHFLQAIATIVEKGEIASAKILRGGKEVELTPKSKTTL